MGELPRPERRGFLLHPPSIEVSPQDSGRGPGATLLAPLQDHARLRGRKPGNQKYEDKMDRYYYACDASSFDRHLKDVDVLVSAGLCWKKEGCCGAGRLAVPKYLDGARSIMIDSGAYSFKEYPFSLEEYVEWVFEFWDTYPQLGYAATPDFIIPRSMDESERRNQIEESLENGWDLMRDCVHPWKQDDIQWIFTIQGSTLADYQHAVQYIWDCEEEGTGGWNYHMAVGSLKGQNDVDEIYRILRHVRENIHSYCSLHAFGLTYQVLKDPRIRNLITSADSGAWRQDCTGAHDRYPKNQGDKLRNFQAYKTRIDRLLEADRTQSSLNASFGHRGWRSA